MYRHNKSTPEGVLESVDDMFFLTNQINPIKSKNLFVRIIQSFTETFRREKSARNTFVSSTREFWNLRSKTKSWNFFEVR